MYIFRKIIFHFSPKETIYFREKEISPTITYKIQERPSFQNIWKKKIWYFVQCLLSMIFD